MEWTLTRNDTAAAVKLPEDMFWSDEYDWSAVAQTSPVYSLSGAVLIQQGVKQAGRPITLTGEWVWVEKSTVDRLREWSDIPELTLTLTHYDGRTFNVCFRTHDKAIAVSPVLYATPEAAGDKYTLTLNLMTV